MKVLTYHTYHSSGVGGVETLFRTLKSYFSNHGLEVNEIYHDVLGEQLYHSRSGRETKLFGASLGDGLIGKIIRKLSIYIYFAVSSVECNTIIILTHPYNLNFIPKRIKKRAKIVLVQINKIDVYLESKNENALLNNVRFVDKVVCYTDMDAHCLENKVNNNSLSNKVEVIPRGCKLKKSNARIFINKKRLVTIARIEEKQKNLQAMVEIFKKLPNEYSLDIYGAGEPEEILQLQSLINGVERATFQGPTNNVADVLKDYDLFIMTSRYEGFGQTLIEARSQGMPLVLFNTFEAASWIVNHGENGYLVEENNILSFVDAIRSICEEKSIYEKFSSKAIEMADMTDINEVNKKWLKLINSLVD